MFLIHKRFEFKEIVTKNVRLRPTHYEVMNAKKNGHKHYN